MPGKDKTIEEALKELEVKDEALKVLEDELTKANEAIETLKSDIKVKDDKISELQKALEEAPSESEVQTTPLIAKVGKTSYKFKYPKINYKGKIYEPETAVKDKEVLKALEEMGICQRTK